MTGYTIEVGYNSCFTREEVQAELEQVVETICKEPQAIAEEVRRIEGRLPDESYAESYRQPWQDLTIRWDTTEDGEKFLSQSASGIGESRDLKEAMRRAFIRLVIEAMHKHQMEINVTVS